MSTDPRPASLSHVGDARAAARRGARTLSGGLIALLAMGVALLLVVAFVLLDYRFNQDPHRLVKILGGLSLIVGILARPDLGLLTLPVLTPFLAWMPKLPIPGVNPLNVLVFSVFFAFLIPAVLRREQNVMRKGALDGVLLALVLVAGLSVIRGAAFPTGFRYDAADAGTQLFRCFMTFSVYFIGYAMSRTERARRNLAWAIVAGVMVEAIVTIAYGRSGRGGRATGSYGQSNDLGAFLAMFTVFSAALLPAVKNWLGRIVLLGAVAVGSIAVLLTVSRGAIFALALGLMIVAVRTSKVVTLVLVALLVTSPLWIPDYVKERINSTQVESEGTDEMALESSSQLRVDTWRAIVQIVTEHPLDGVGFSGLGYILPDIGAALGVQVKDSAHSTYMRFLGEMGVFGLGLLLFLLWKCLALGRAGERAAGSGFDRQLGVGLSSLTIVLAVCCAFGDRFFPIVITGNFWLLCGLVNSVIDERARKLA
jgi:O-antigen ligase